MNFFDKLGAAASAYGERVEGAFGAAWAAAQEANDQREAGDLGGALKTAFGGGVGLATMGTGIGQAQLAAPGVTNRVLNWMGAPLDVVQRSSSTWMRVNDATLKDNDPTTFELIPWTSQILDRETWRRAWKDADTASPGQTFQTLAGLTPDNVTLGTDPASTQAREDFFTGDWRGKYVSGTFDFLMNVYADPLIIGGKAGTAARKASRTVRPEEASRVLATSRGEMAAKGRIGRLAGKLDATIRLTDNMSAAEIAALPQIRNTGDAAGALGYFFERANTRFAGDAEEMITARHGVKRDLLGAIIGDTESIARLKGRDKFLAHELQRTLDTPPPTKFVKEFSWNDGGSWVIRQVQEDMPPEIDEYAKGIQAEMDRLERVLTAKSGQVAASGREIRKYGKDMRRTADSTWDKPSNLRQSIIYTSLGGRPVRVLQALASNRLPGHVNVADTMSGFDQLSAYLNSAKYVDGRWKRALLDDYVKAATRGDRQGVVKKAEAVVLDSVAQQYKLSAAERDALRKAGDTRRQAWLNVLQERLYSADPNQKMISVVDPESDEIIAFPRPLLRSQIEDQVNVVDPSMLDKFVKKAKGQRVLETWASREMYEESPAAWNAASTVLDKADNVKELYDQVMMWGTRMWKDSVLFRLAYPIRVQVDTQMRLVTYMGTLNYLKQVPDMWVEYNTMRFGWGKGQKAEEAIDLAVKRRLQKAGVPEEMIPTVTRMIRSEAGSQADLAGELAGRDLAAAKATGRWGIVDPGSADDAMWGGAYLRAVNYQIRNSPTAMRFVEGWSKSDVKRWVRNTPEGRNEWAELAGSHQNDVDLWLAKLESHVNHYLPDTDLRERTIAGDLRMADLEDFFGKGNLENRMVVHGESFAPTEKNELLERYENMRKRWYRWASEAPETVLGRSPLYAFAYKRHFEEFKLRMGDAPYVTTDDVRRIQVAADRAARREMGQVLFDSSHVSNLASHFKFIAPFFAAWEDMMKKWGNLLYERPHMVLRGSQIWNAPNNAGWVVDSNGNRVDAKGKTYLPVKNPDGSTSYKLLDPKKDKALIGDGEYFILPFGIFKDKDDSGIGAMRIRKDSFNIAFQGDPWWLPGMGPVVAVPVNYTMRRSFPDLADHPIAKYVLPFGLSDREVKDEFLPSWVRQARNAFGGTQDYVNIYSLLLAQETSRYYAGERPDKPTSEELESKTRNWFILRAVTANASPVSMQPSPELQFYVDQAHIYRSKYADDWQVKFDEDFPQFYRMRLSLSANETGIVATDNAYKVASDPKMRRLIANNPEWGWAVVGPDNYYGTGEGTEFSQGVYTWELTQAMGYGNTATFRSKRDNPRDALKEVEASQGWHQYQTAREALNLELEKRGLTLNQKAAAGIKAVWDDYIVQLRKYNPSWAEDFDMTDRGKATRFLQDAVAMGKEEPMLGNRGDFQTLRDYLDQREQMRAVLATRESKSLDSVANKDLKDVWDAYTQQLMSSNLGFEMMYNRVLFADDLSQEVTW